MTYVQEQGKCVLKELLKGESSLVPADIHDDFVAKPEFDSAKCQEAGRIFINERCLKICRDLKKFKYDVKKDRCNLLPQYVAQCSPDQKLDTVHNVCVDLPKKTIGDDGFEYCPKEGHYWSRSKQRCRRISARNCKKFGRVYHKEENQRRGICLN